MTRNLLNILTRPFKAFRQSPWALSSALPSRIDASLLVEEETSPYEPPIFIRRGSVKYLMTGIKLRPSLATEVDRVYGL